MKNMILAVAVLVAASTASAAVGEWTETSLGGGYYQYTLNVTASDTIMGVDLSVAGASTFETDGTAIQDTSNAVSHFPFQTSHFVFGTGTVNDLVVAAQYVGDIGGGQDALVGGFNVTSQGIYAGGLGTSVDVLDIVVSGQRNPLSDFVFADSSGSLAPAINVNGQLEGLTVVPEPATMAVLGLGGIAALIRRRRA